MAPDNRPSRPGAGGTDDGTVTYACPTCHSSATSPLKDVNQLAHLNYYRCAQCGALWYTMKDVYDPLAILHRGRL